MLRKLRPRWVLLFCFLAQVSVSIIQQHTINDQRETIRKSLAALGYSSRVMGKLQRACFGEPQNASAVYE